MNKRSGALPASAKGISPLPKVRFKSGPPSVSAPAGKQQLPAQPKTPTFGYPTVLEILEEWADGRAYGEHSHFIREFSRVAVVEHRAALESNQALRDELDLRDATLIYHASVMRQMSYMEAEIATLKEEVEDLNASYRMQHDLREHFETLCRRDGK